jgi:uncharacterized protein YqgV (UPF0045/DUF77 family)
MNIAVEISLYPLSDNYLVAIGDFIARLQKYPQLQVRTNTMSTQIKGAYEQVFAALQCEMKDSFTENAKSVFVLKVLGPTNDTQSL